MSVHSRYPGGPLEDQRQFFDELITEEWPSYKSDAWDYSRRFEVSRLLRTLRPERILDIGCGCGFHDSEMAKFDFVREVDAFDYSSQSVLKADEAYPHPKVTRRVADIHSDPVEPVYDLVVSFQVFEHLPRPDAYFDYCLRATRPGGAIAIVTPNRARLDNRIRQWRGEPPAVLDNQHFHEYTRAELQALGRRFGLTPIDSFGHGFQSLLYPQVTPKDFRRVASLGAMLPAVASVIGVVFQKPHAARAAR
jgi:SAM-dependent methyltransferase